MPRRALIALLALLALPAPAQAIVGGQPASRSYPHMAQLLQDGTFVCGGSLVAQSWVLTAAHCVEDENGTTLEPSRLTVVLGRQRLSGDGGEVHPLQAVLKHPQYTGGGFDVALLHLSAPSALTPIRIVSAAERSLWNPGVAATVTGWGAQFSGGDASDELREVQVTIRDDADCNASANIGSYDPDTMLCAGEPLGGRDSCQGDSGGPLTVPGAGGRDVLAGVVSSGVGCALPAAYGVYARIGDETLNAWLRENLPGDPTTGGGTPATPPELTVGRLRLRGGRLRVPVTVNVALRAVKLRVTRRGKTYATGASATLRGSRTYRLKPRRKLRRGTYRVTLRAVDAQGATVALRASVHF